jgi:hypothetical protein
MGQTPWNECAESFSKSLLLFVQSEIERSGIVNASA